MSQAKNLRPFSGRADDPKTLLLTCCTGVAFGVAACQTATPYQPITAGQAQAMGGYSDTMLAPGRWQVMFKGNSLTSRETVETYMLYRAAQLALQNGYDWFTTSDRVNETRVRETVGYPYAIDRPWGRYWGPSWRYHGLGAPWRVWDPWGTEPFMDVTTVTEYEASATVTGGRGPIPADDPHAFDARTTVDTLANQIVLPHAR